MAMERKLASTSEDKDLLIQRCNKILARKGFDYLKDAIRLTRGELTDTLKKAALMNDFTSKDNVVLHFNRFQDTTKMQQFTDHVATHKFPTKAVAKAFIEATIREAWERVPTPSKIWHSHKRLALNDWIIITADGPYSLEDIMEAKIPKDYKLPAPYDYYAEQIMAYHWGLHPQVNSRTLASKNKPALTPALIEKHAPPSRIRQSNERQTATPKPEKVPKASLQSQNKAPTGRSRDKPAIRQPKTGLISLEALCTLLKLDPRAVRQALRSSNYPKPGARWEWDKSDTDKITADIKRIMK